MVSLDHINFSVSNLKESIIWYQETFNFKVVEKGVHKDLPFAIVKNGESMLCMYELSELSAPGSHPSHRSYHFGLRVRNQEAWEKHLTALKIKPKLTWEYPHSKSWYIDDPTGHEIEVSYWHGDQIKF